MPARRDHLTAHPGQRHVHRARMVMYREQARQNVLLARPALMKLTTPALIATRDMSPARQQHHARPARPEPMKLTTPAWIVIPDMFLRKQPLNVRPAKREHTKPTTPVFPVPPAATHHNPRQRNAHSALRVRPTEKKGRHPVAIVFPARMQVKAVLQPVPHAAPASSRQDMVRRIANSVHPARLQARARLYAAMRVKKAAKVE